MTDRIAGVGGCELAVHRVGAGRPVVLLHGLFSSARINWIKFGHAQRLADAGFEAIMPDLRVHGDSDAPHDPAAYPTGVLMQDLNAVIDAFGLADFDLVGFSLGARTAAEAVIEGLAPRRLVLGGMGLGGLTGWDQRVPFFIDAIDRFDDVRHGDPAFVAVSFMKTMKIDRVAARLLLGSVDDVDVAHLSRIDMPTAVICGALDSDNGSPQDLAEALPDGRYVEVPGTHMSSVTAPELGQAIAAFLSD
jgi:pimeloyl-ACP methyl ester carboxylesterase